MPANTGLSEKTEIRLKQPKQYKVVMYNDDFTPMDVVVEILIDVFRKNYEEAVAIMMTVHKESRGGRLFRRYCKDEGGQGGEDCPGAGISIPGRSGVIVRRCADYGEDRTRIKAADYDWRMKKFEDSKRSGRAAE